jgi:hypothetical protein
LLTRVAGRAEFVIAKESTGRTITVRRKTAVTLCPEASVTFTERGYDPGTAVIPLMTPLETCNWIPDGRAPVARLHWYGATPPTAESEVE